jgi:hypothetical protein
MGTEKKHAWQRQNEKIKFEIRKQILRREKSLKSGQFLKVNIQNLQ